MACIQNVLIFVAVCALAVSMAQVSQGGPHTDQGGPHSDQGGPHSDQGGASGPQGGPHVSQGGPHENQGRARREVQGSGNNQGGPHVSQGGPHQNQGRGRREVQGSENNEDQSETVWTTCDFTVTPKISCQDCHTKLICKPIGGILKACNSPFRPYCNNGICSATPSAECA